MLDRKCESDVVTTREHECFLFNAAACGAINADRRGNTYRVKQKIRRDTRHLSITTHWMGAKSRFLRTQV